MTISPKGVALIASFEGCRLKAYQCQAGKWTIGYGHTEGVKKGDTLKSEKEARRLLEKDLGKYAGYVAQAVIDGIIAFELNQNQFDALTSFVYNLGHENLVQLVTERDAKTVAKKMLLYNKVKKQGKLVELHGLTRRREREQELFLKEVKKGAAK